MSIKVNGKMARPVVKVFSLINKDPCMRELGKMINIMEKELNNGTIIKLFTLEISLTAKRQEKVNLSSMETSMRETSLMENSTVKESTTFLSLVKSMKVNSMRTTCTERVE